MSQQHGTPDPRSSPWSKVRGWIGSRLQQWRLKRAYAELAKFPKHCDPPRHSLPGDLVISLTSFPGRYATLHLTLKSILDQTVRPDGVVLWIAHEQMAELPRDVLDLQNHIFSVRGCEDLRSFKKILPSLEAFPGAFILIADDDTYYEDRWLEDIVSAFDPNEPTIVCRRAHRVTYAPDGQLAPYRQWPRNVTGPETLRPSRDLLPTGNGGVLYPPGALPPMTSNLELIRKLSPTSDDVWLFFMWQQAGWSIKRASKKKQKLVEWPGSQQQSLRDLHRTGPKDRHLQDLSRHFRGPKLSETQ